MGSVIKCMAVYEEPFWREDGLTGQAVSLPGPAQVVFDNTPPNGSAGLIGFLEGREARELGALPEAERRQAVLRGFVRLFGRRASHPVLYVERGLEHRALLPRLLRGRLRARRLDRRRRAPAPAGWPHSLGRDRDRDALDGLHGRRDPVGEARGGRGSPRGGVRAGHLGGGGGGTGAARPVRLIDVRHLGRERVIGCWELDGVLIDPGPTSSMDNLIEALDGREPRALLLTHIHLDHAGAAGSLVRRWPELPVYVHERGARHLADPGKLLASAERLYGDQMERLWGEVVPVPQANLHPLTGGEEVLGLRVAYTPGHASHHVSYLDPASGRAFVGDVAAVRIPPSDFVIPPTPPPDIEIELWEESIDRILDWEPASLGLAHFDAIERPEEHLELVRERLREQAALARELSAAAFEERIRAQVAERADPEAGEAMLQAVPPEQQWAGLDRYWETRKSTA